LSALADFPTSLLLSLLGYFLGSLLLGGALLLCLSFCHKRHLLSAGKSLRLVTALSTENFFMIYIFALANDLGSYLLRLRRAAPEREP
jgi:hypothetical protein